MNIVFFLVSVLMIIMGIIIRKYTLVHLIAGYDEEKTEDKQGLANWVGSNLIIMGLLSFLNAFLASVINDATIWFITAFIAIIVIFSIRTAVGYKKYERSV